MQSCMLLACILIKAQLLSALPIVERSEAHLSEKHVHQRCYSSAGNPGSCGGDGFQIPPSGGLGGDGGSFSSTSGFSKNSYDASISGSSSSGLAIGGGTHGGTIGGGISPPALPLPPVSNFDGHGGTSGGNLISASGFNKNSFNASVSASSSSGFAVGGSAQSGALYGGNPTAGLSFPPSVGFGGHDGTGGASGFNKNTFDASASSSSSSGFAISGVSQGGALGGEVSPVGFPFPPVDGLSNFGGAAGASLGGASGYNKNSFDNSASGSSSSGLTVGSVTQGGAAGLASGVVLGDLGGILGGLL
ncbi:expressed protein [Phakopsora pachyrhizi]|uniref:Expressed protein n=1 Tax=Phakopsora pachyrhizi TaxID=170000 RepID=A0AAV0ATP7_PHAPC|nr:expressed protein [Phakopsora pachyrhizi]